MTKAAQKQRKASEGRDSAGRFAPGNKLSEGNEGGAPSLYNQDIHPKLGERLAKLGLKDDEIAEAFDVTPRTLYNWKCKHPELLQALTLDNTEGKAVFDKRIERSLGMQAMGYEVEEDKVFFPSGSKDPVIVTVKKHIPGNTTAAIFWLKNRSPDLWRDRQDLNLQVNDGMQQITTEDLEKRLLERMKDVTPKGVTQDTE